ncbi:MAG: MBOAT family O-acyltransferase [Marvinbryantia sp.]|jgi:alginate O-acetyltransferase complex protein AlgI
MVFSSLLFMFRFLPVVLILYFAAPVKFRNIILFLFSLFFYAWGEPKYVLLMLCSITVDYLIGRRIQSFKNQGKIRAARSWLVISIVYNLSVLGFFKYADFLIGSVNNVLGTAIPLPGIPLPIGISFFTFQTMSYTIDVYKGATTAQKNWMKYGTYVSMFPQLIAGPIVQYKTIAEQLEFRKETTDDFVEGIHRFMIGAGKKVLLANNIGVLWDTVSTMPTGTLPAATAWLGALAYTFQIYFDFSGYSDMAIGLGKMFGFHFLENFNYPYISKSITEFWRRWHISLSSWFREYVYIPLGGNRRGVAKQVRNIAVVWLLTGIWHGASWNFVLWGVYYGALLLLEKFVFAGVLKRLPKIFRSVYTLFFVVVGWIIFAFDNMSVGLQYLKTMFTGAGCGFADSNTIYLLYNYAILFVILILGSTQLPKKAAGWCIQKLGKASWITVAARMVFYAGIFLLTVAYLVDASYNPFLYFRF